jgi:tetratricopeptide (TPR) repeat protein
LWLPHSGAFRAEGNFNHSKGHRTKRKALMRQTVLQFVLAVSLLAFPLALALPAQYQQAPQDPAAKPPASPQDQKQPPAKSSDEPSAKPAAQPQSATSPATDTSFDPFHAEQDIEIGTFYMHKGDVDAAIPRFEDAARLRPSYGKPRLLLAECYEKKHEPATALKYYKEYLKVYPNAPDRKTIEKKIEKLSGK